MVFKIYINNTNAHPYSTATHVKIFKSADFIGVAFTTNEMEVMNPPQVVATIKEILDKNMPTEAISFGVYMDVDSLETSLQKQNSVRLVEAIRKLAADNERFTVDANAEAVESKLMKAISSNQPAKYNGFTASQELRNLGVLNDEDDDLEDYFELDDDYEDDDDEEDEDEDDELGEDDIPGLSGFSFGRRRRNKKNSYYGKSRVWKDSNHIRRSINRHGVVISTKSNMDRDKKILKEFLKDFIPGNKGWEKSFRAELAKRWMAVYVVSKKQLKNLEKNHRNKKNYKSNKNNLKGAFSLASKILAPKNDIWFDPNR